MAKKAKSVVDERLQKWEEFAAANSALYALIDADGNLLGDCAYDFIREPQNGFAIFKKDGKYGFLRVDGSVAVDPLYESVSDFNEYGIAAVRIDGSWGFINEKGEMVITPQYEDLSYPFFREGLAAITKNGKEGFIDKDGNEVIPPVYEMAYRFDDGLAGVKVDGKIGFIDKTGKMVIAPAYDKVEGLHEGGWRAGFAIVTTANKKGLIDRKGNIVLPMIYDDITFFPGMASSRQTVGEKTYYDISVKPQGEGIISDDGIIAEPVYGKIAKYSEGMAAASKDGKVGYLDADGNIALPFEYDSASPFSGNYARVKKDGRSFVIDKTGREICDKVESIRFGCEDPLEGYVAGIKDGKYGLLDQSGNFILSCEFDNIEQWGITSLIKVSKDNKCGVYDLSGKEVIKTEFYYIDTPRFEGVPVRISAERWEKEGVVTTDGRFILNPDEFKSCSVDEKGGVIIVKDKEEKAGLRGFDGSEITPCVFDYLYDFSDNGVAKASLEKKYGLLDRNGQWVIPAEYENIEVMSEGFIGAKKDGKWGFINDKNEWVIAPAYDRIYEGFKNGYAIVMNDSKYILINRAGKELTKPSANLYLSNPADGLILFKVGRKFGYLDTEGNIAIKPAFDEAKDFDNGCALVSIKVEKQPMWTFVTKDGLTHETFENEVYNLGHLIPVEKEGKKALFRPTGTMAVPFVLKQVPRAIKDVLVIQFI